MKVKTVLTRKGWYYISNHRKHGRNPLWVGPFDSEADALLDAAKNEV